MGVLPLHQTPTLTLTLTLLLLSLLFPSISSEDLYNLVYKGCATQRGGAASPQAVAALSSALLAQSSSSKFYKTTSGSSSGQPLSGLYQCRGDLSGSDCAACVAHALPAWTEQCGPSSPAARVQLVGCYALYQVAGFPQAGGMQMLFKTCSSSSGGGGDFEMKRGTALSSLESGVAGGGRGFYATSYGDVYAMAQCEGELSAADCAECVAQAVQKAEVECGGAAAGQVYLDKCYISYSYYSNGVPHGSGGGGGGGVGGTAQQTGKTVAIVVGAAAGLGFLVICLLFASSLWKKKDDY